MDFRKLFLPIALIFLAGCSENDTSSIKSDIKIPQAKKEEKIKFPINLKTMKNVGITVNKIDKGFSFSNSKDKAVLLNFFTSWCPPCKAEIPHLNILQNKYKDSLEIIGVLLEDKNINEIQDFINKYKVNFTVTQGKSNFTIAKAVGDVKAIPFMILYDKKGEYATHYVGAVPEEMMNVDIKKVVKQ